MADQNPASPASPSAAGSRRTVRGTPVVQGIALGPAITISAGLDLSQLPTGVSDRESEKSRYTHATDVVADRLRARSATTRGVAADVLLAQVALVKDNGLAKAAVKAIEAGSNAEHAIHSATEQFIVMFDQLGGLMTERNTDLLDLRHRVICELMGEPEPGILSPDVPSILFADDLAPADAAVLDPRRIVALITRLGGPTSHTAIIARHLGLPCIVAAPFGDVEPGTMVLINGGNGQIEFDPDLEVAQALIDGDLQTRAAAEAWYGPGRTADGHPIEILANVHDGPSARMAGEGPAEGVGLFRSELAFLDQEFEPTLEQQSAIYQQVLAAYAGHKVVIRTLDAGSDKPMKFANLTHEENPSLGVRGIRLASGNPDLLTHQLDAIADAAQATDSLPWVMAPMIATEQEAHDFAAQVRDRGLQVGVMVEVPSVALLAERILRQVDFLSIGTNDLSQFTMAADRLNPSLTNLTDPWQPAVLHLIALIARAGTMTRKPVGVCGEAAADPLLACVLVGLGITSLSMAASAIKQVGASVGSVSYIDCQQAAAAALAAESPSAARAAAAAALGR